MSDEKILIINRKNGEYRFVKPGEVLAVDRTDDWYEPDSKKMAHIRKELHEKAYNKQEELRDDD